MARRKHRGIFERPEGSGVWWILFHDQYGRRHREKVGFKSVALRICQQRKTEIQQGKFEPEDVKRKHRNATVPEIIDDYLDAYRAGGRKAIKDTRVRAGYWKDLWHDRAARSILPSDIERARAELLESQYVSNKQEEAHQGSKSSENQPLPSSTEGRFLFGGPEWEGGAQSRQAGKIGQRKQQTNPLPDRRRRGSSSGRTAWRLSWARKGCAAHRNEKRGTAAPIVERRRLSAKAN
jgi:hypothetical protein